MNVALFHVFMTFMTFIAQALSSQHSAFSPVTDVATTNIRERAQSAQCSLGIFFQQLRRPLIRGNVHPDVHNVQSPHQAKTGLVGDPDALFNNLRASHLVVSNWILVCQRA